MYNCWYGMSEFERKLDAVFFRTEHGNEPVREWLLSLPKIERKAMNDRNISKAEMAKRLKTSRTGVDRLLDPQNTSITLNTMAKVASLLGKRMESALR